MNLDTHMVALAEINMRNPDGMLSHTHEKGSCFFTTRQLAQELIKHGAARKLVGSDAGESEASFLHRASKLKQGGSNG